MLWEVRRIKNEGKKDRVRIYKKKRTNRFGGLKERV